MANIDMSNNPTYTPEAVQPMRDEMVFNGFKELFTSDDVDEVLNGEGTTLLFINSVCGCSAGSARPGAILSIRHHTIPDRLVTLFAGQERVAIEYVRQKHLSNFMPSSPFIALFKNGKVIYALQRHEIEGTHPEKISDQLKKEYEFHCIRKVSNSQ